MRKYFLYYTEIFLALLTLIESYVDFIQLLATDCAFYAFLIFSIYFES